MYTNKGQKEDDSFNAFHCKRLRGARASWRPVCGPCRCHTHLVTTDAELHKLPRRRTDGALVLDARLQVVKLYTQRREGSKAVRREKGVERQYLHGCPSCNQDVGYTSKPHEAPLELVYLLESSVDVPWHRMKSPWTCKAQCAEGLNRLPLRSAAISARTWRS